MTCKRKIRGRACQLPNPEAVVEIAYAVLLEPEPDGSAFNVIVPALPEIATFGSTPEHALEMAKDAIELSLAYRREKGLRFANVPTH